MTKQELAKVERDIEYLAGLIRQAEQGFVILLPLTPNSVYHDQIFNALLAAAVGTGSIGFIFHRPVNFAVALVMMVVCGIYGTFPTPND